MTRRGCILPDAPAPLRQQLDTLGCRYHAAGDSVYVVRYDHASRDLIDWQQGCRVTGCILSDDGGDRWFTLTETPLEREGRITP